MASEEEQLDTIEKFQKAVKLTAILRQKPTSDEEMQRAQKALIKPVSIRNAEDFEAIEKVMIRVKFFTKVKLKYGLLVFKEVCKHLYYKRAQPGHIMIKVNNEGKAFYVILRGSVGINIFLPKVSQKQAESKSTFGVNEIEFEDEPFEYQEVNVLSIGDSFGEVALLDPNSKTTATVITKDICEFACLDKEQYINILGVLNQAEMNEKMSFVRGIHFLHGWFDNDLKTLSFHFELMYYERNDVIYRENSANDGYIYFLKKGEISLLKLFQRQQIYVCNLCVGEIFGEEMYLGINNRQHTAICNVQDTQVYRLAKSDLDKRMWQIENRNLFKESVEIRWEWRNQRFDNLKLFEAKVEQEENLQKYLKPKTESILERPQIQQSHSTKISSYTCVKPFNFMEPLTAADELFENNGIQSKIFQNKIKVRQYNSSKQSLRNYTYMKQQSQIGLIKQNQQRKENLKKTKRVNSQQFKSFLQQKFQSEEHNIQNQLPFNFINQETQNEPTEQQQQQVQQKLTSFGQSQQNSLYEDVIQFAVSQKQKTLIKLPQANSTKYSSKENSFKKLSQDQIHHRKSPSNLSYEFSDAKGSFQYKRLFKY
ncbi:unnamed protein product (macronuclear) [Paramecium tetraurelia]|uniref:Cyclic nucleotide-binding domain-containing protein n=1 Tax=Paramecium tetraurelia TaxID=5888 RepID=A0BTS4_PARTE|nr:uncharacterized protein GSPATT00032173001 [Paramecium tetraurelia]CAK61941.1 unnamed protein product [Paramecium tetraurelia]|eukprot:XP_001429339.1 hypothetical protein (macronuclear) [Paramecium tetraurelia strain d4-2]